MSDDTRLTTSKITSPIPFEIRPSDVTRGEMAERLELLALRKVSFVGTVAPFGARDLKLEAMLGATVQQPCIVTGQPVTTRIDEPVLRAYIADMTMPEADEVEMPEDDNAEPLPVEIDLISVMEEALVLALPDWPRAEGVDPVDLTVTEPGVAPMTDEDAKPFAQLKALRDKLGGGEDG